MQTIVLTAGELSTRVSAAGGALLDAHYGGTPILRPYTGNESSSFDPRSAGCFPMVPFGGRIADNAFTYANNTYHLHANTSFDQHYLHGDGWLNEWRVMKRLADEVTLSLEHEASDITPYTYLADLTISVRKEVLRLELAVTNRGSLALPFGLGFHPYFPLTPKTTLQAKAKHHWTEGPNDLPGVRGPLPKELNFQSPTTIPARSIHNVFEGWDGNAEINWPEHQLTVAIQTDNSQRRYVLFRPDATYDSEYNNEYFCFEPMTHTCNAHKLPENAGLVHLEPGQSLASWMTIKPAIKLQ